MWILRLWPWLSRRPSRQRHANDCDSPVRGLVGEAENVFEGKSSTPVAPSDRRDGGEVIPLILACQRSWGEVGSPRPEFLGGTVGDRTFRIAGVPHHHWRPMSSASRRPRSVHSSKVMWPVSDRKRSGRKYYGASFDGAPADAGCLTSSREPVCRSPSWPWHSRMLSAPVSRQKGRRPGNGRSSFQCCSVGYVVVTQAYA